MVTKQTVFTLLVLLIIVKVFAEYHHYFKLGSKSELVCPIPRSTWTGPPAREIYAVGMDVIPNKTSVISINITDDASVLIFKKFAEGKAGFYECFDNKANFSYHVHIHTNPTNLNIMNKVDNGIIHIGDSEIFVLKCSITQGEPPSLLTWIHNAKIVTSTRMNYLSYTINASTKENGSVYTCEASDDNKRTLLSKTVTLSIRRDDSSTVLPPSKPTHVQVVGYITKVFVKWQSSHTTNLEAINYTVEYKRHDAIKWIEIYGITTTQYCVQNLEPDTLYSVQLYASNQGGSGNRTAEYIVKTEHKTTKQLNWPLVVTICILSMIVTVLIFKAYLEMKRRCSNTNNERPTTTVELTTQSRTMTIQTGTTAHYDEIQSMPSTSIDRNVHVVDSQSNEEAPSSLQNKEINFSIYRNAEGQDVDKIEHDSSGYLLPCHDIPINELEQLHVDISGPRQSLSSESDNSETIVKSDNKYEKLPVRRIDVHNYNTVETIETTNI